MGTMPNRSGLFQGAALVRYFKLLLDRFGEQHWWPARSRLEIILGAILVQNTAWPNAALAIARLRSLNLLSPERLKKAGTVELEEAIRPAGFYRQKALTIRTFLAWLDGECKGSIARVFSLTPAEARAKLLKVNGFGPETVDAILLYAGHKPVFPADAYTRRVMSRHGLVPAKSNYEGVQRFLHRELPPDPALFNEFHALLVEVGKRYCLKLAPRCEDCPLQELLPGPGSAPSGKPQVRQKINNGR